MIEYNTAIVVIANNLSIITANQRREDFKSAYYKQESKEIDESLDVMAVIIVVVEVKSIY